jgi:hypothetical protein
MVRSAMEGMEPMEKWGIPPKMIFSYISSVMTTRSGAMVPAASSMTRARARSSASEYIVLHGFDGEFRSTARVRGVIAALSCAGETLNSVCGVVGTSTTFPPASSQMEA